MRLLGRSLFVATIAILLIGLFVVVRSELLVGSTDAELPLDTRESPAYAVDPQRELEFRLSGHANQVRLRTHGLVPRYGDDMPRRTHDFALAITVLASDGTPLARRIEHYRTALVRLRDATTGAPERVNFVTDPTVDVVGTALTILDLADMPTAEVLRVRLAQADPDIREVGLRVYEPEALPEHSIAASWQRLSVPQRERLAEGNVYPMSLLTDEEVAAIMTRRWRPVGPTGIEGEDYRVRTLFVREEGNGQPDKLLVPQGTYVDRQHQVSLAVSDPGRYLIRASAVPGTSAASAGTLSLNLQVGSEPPVRLSWSGTTIEHAIELSPGTLAISSDRPAALRFYRLMPDERIELAPSRKAVRAFPVSKADGLEFFVHRRVAVPTSVRVDLRQWLNSPDGEPAASVAVTYEASGATGNIIDSGIIEVGREPSPRASLIDDPTTILSVAVRRDLTLAPDVVRLRFSADRTVYVTAYSRIETGSEASGGDVAGRASERWFSFMPVGGKRLVQNGSTIVTVESSGTLVAVGDDDAP